MCTIEIRGKIPLAGTVEVSGSKNAALPMVFASIITKGVSVLRRTPKITDIDKSLEILKALGAVVYRREDTVYIDTRTLTPAEIEEGLLRSIRASTYLLGSMLSRFGECRISSFGGCGFSSRPIDMHIAALEAFGGRVDGDIIRADGLRGTILRFNKQSVGATINSIILASSAEGESEIYGYAKEPHVLALIDFLKSAGAQIAVDDEKISVRGKELHGGDITVIGDMIEAGTYLSAGLATGGRVGTSGCEPRELSAFLDTIEKMGARVWERDGVIFAEQTGRLKTCSVICEAYPGFPTDLQPICGALMSTMLGGIIIDRVWPERYGYLDSLSPLGLKHRRLCSGVEILPSDLIGSTVTATDLRGGAAAVICALAAEGKSTVCSAEHILRGYENIDGKLRSLGADVALEM